MLHAYVPTAYYAPRCVVCDLSCRFTATVKLPEPIASPSTGRKRYCAHAECMEVAWTGGSDLPLPTPTQLAASQTDRGSFFWQYETANGGARKDAAATTASDAGDPADNSTPETAKNPEPYDES